LSELEETIALRQALRLFLHLYSGACVCSLGTIGLQVRRTVATQERVSGLPFARSGDGALYWAMSRMDIETRNALWQSLGLRETDSRCRGFSSFYGSHISIRAGKVIVPGGALAESAWKDLVGVSPESPAEFTIPPALKDDGWLAAYFDALSRVGQKQQPYFTESHHLHNFYEALRGKDLSPSPTRPLVPSGSGTPSFL